MESMPNKGGEREPSSDLVTKSHEAAEQTKQVAMERVASVRESTQSAKELASARLRKLSGTVRKLGEHLKIENQHYVADKAVTASEQLDGFATYVSTADLRTLVRDTGTLARNQPAAFFGSAFIIGLAAGRLLKAGSENGASDTKSATTITTTTTTQPSARSTSRGVNR